MRFFHLIIFQLRSWLRDLRPFDLDSKPNLFDLLLLDFLFLVSAGLWPPAFLSTSLGLSARADTPKCIGHARRCNFLAATNLWESG